jgi:hypothetical protein
MLGCAGGPLLPEARAPASAGHAHAKAYRPGEAVLLRTASRLVPASNPTGAAGFEERWVPARVRAVRPDGGYDIDVADDVPHQRAGVAAADLRHPPGADFMGHLPAATPGAPARPAAAALLPDSGGSTAAQPASPI